MKTGEYFNPWLVSSLDEYLFYCCPECDLKTRGYEVFFNHAIECHSKAKVLVEPMTDNIVPDNDNLETNHFAEEVDQPVTYGIKKEIQDDIRLLETIPSAIDTEYQEVPTKPKKSKPTKNKRKTPHKQRNFEGYCDPLAVQGTPGPSKSMESILSDSVDVKVEFEDEGFDMDVEYIQDDPNEPLDMEDYPLLPEGITRSELVKVGQEQNIDFNYKISTKCLYRKIQFLLKRRHPLRSHLARLSMEELKKLHEQAIGPINPDKFHQGIREFKAVLVKHYFTNYSGGPLSALLNDQRALVEAYGSEESVKAKRGSRKRKIPIVLQTTSSYDYSTLVSEEMTIDQLVRKLEDRGIYYQGEYEKERLRSTLENALKRAHPIHSVIDHLIRKEAKVLVVYAGGDPSKITNKSERQMKAKLADLCFQNHPTAPLAYLKSLQEEYTNTDLQTHRDKMENVTY